MIHWTVWSYCHINTCESLRCAYLCLQLASWWSGIFSHSSSCHSLMLHFLMIPRLKGWLFFNTMKMKFFPWQKALEASSKCDFDVTEDNHRHITLVWNVPHLLYWVLNVGVDVPEPNPLEEHPTASSPIAPWCLCSYGHCYQDTAGSHALKKSNTNTCDNNDVCTPQDYPEKKSG